MAQQQGGINLSEHQVEMKKQRLREGAKRELKHENDYNFGLPRRGSSVSTFSRPS